MRRFKYIICVDPLIRNLANLMQRESESGVQRGLTSGIYFFFKALKLLNIFDFDSLYGPMGFLSLISS